MGFVSTYLTKYGQPGKQGGRPSKSKTSITSARISDELRYDQMNHWVSEVPQTIKDVVVLETTVNHMFELCV